MDRAALQEVLRELVQNNTNEPIQHFAEDTDLRTGLGLDSVDLISLVMEIQERLRVAIAVAEFERLHCIGDLLDLLLLKLPARQRAA